MASGGAEMGSGAQATTCRSTSTARRSRAAQPGGGGRLPPVAEKARVPRCGRPGARVVPDCRIGRLLQSQNRPVETPRALQQHSVADSLVTQRPGQTDGACIGGEPAEIVQCRSPLEQGLHDVGARRCLVGAFEGGFERGQCAQPPVVLDRIDRQERTLVRPRRPLLHGRPLMRLRQIVPVRPLGGGTEHLGPPAPGNADRSLDREARGLEASAHHVDEPALRLNPFAVDDNGHGRRLMHASQQARQHMSEPEMFEAPLFFGEEPRRLRKVEPQHGDGSTPSADVQDEALTRPQAQHLVDVVEEREGFGTGAWPGVDRGHAASFIAHRNARRRWRASVERSGPKPTCGESEPGAHRRQATRAPGRKQQIAGRNPGLRPAIRSLHSREPAGDYACRAACTSSVMVTLSPTSTPPVSSAAFQFTPNSLRSISVFASKPAL